MRGRALALQVKNAGPQYACVDGFPASQQSKKQSWHQARACAAAPGARVLLLLLCAFWERLEVSAACQLRGAHPYRCTAGPRRTLCGYRESGLNFQT